MNTTVSHSDDLVTIREAIRLLRNGSLPYAPSYQTFYKAIERGKIEKETVAPSDNKNPVRVSWASVQAYVAAGGFSSSGKSSTHSSKEIQIRQSAVPECNTTTPDSISLNGDTQASHSKLQPAAPDSQLNQLECEVQTQQNESAKLDSQVVRTKQKINEGSSQEGGKQTPSAALPTVIGNKTRKAPSLRMLKNSLRRLTFEETKAIRDWADNRLLTVVKGK